VGTLVERTIRPILLPHLPSDAIRQAITTRPADLARTITWDRDKRNGLPRGLHHRHRHPGLLQPAHKPWQRGSDENTYWCKVGLPGLI
jgi:IS30 family transposase